MPISSASPTPRSGEALRSGEKKAASKFELIAELGRGGMATVYLARAKNRPERLIVLKQLRSDLADNPEFLAMFLEEARLAGKLQHPNIVETYEVGQDGDTYYIAMEYLDGLSLQAVLTKFGWKGKFTFAMQVFVLIEALRALEQAYSQRDDDGTPLRIVHRDVSPPNIMLTFSGQAKLVDFGIAKAANSNIETRTGLIKGKLTYMAPEQAASGDVDSRTDIYSIGVMLWQAAAGKRRWKGIENTEVLKRLHAGAVADSPNAKANGLPSVVDKIVLKAIAADPEARFTTPADFRAALEKLLVAMGTTVSSKTLSTFMVDEFEEARKRANEVLTLRLAQLDAESASEESVDEHESLTAIRAATKTTSPKAKARGSVEGERDPKSAARNKSDSGKPQASGSAAAARDRSNSARLPEQSEQSSQRISPEISAASGKSRVVPMAIAGVVIAAALIFLTIKTHRSEVPPALQSHSTTAASPSDQSSPPIVQTDPPASAAPVATEKTRDVATPSLPRGRHHRGQSPARPTTTPVQVTAPLATPAPVPAATTASPPTAPLATATAPQQDDSHPAVDKQDPWPKTNVDKNDPWQK